MLPHNLVHHTSTVTWTVDVKLAYHKSVNSNNGDYGH